MRKLQTNPHIYSVVILRRDFRYNSPKLWMAGEAVEGGPPWTRRAFGAGPWFGMDYLRVKTHEAYVLVSIYACRSQCRLNFIVICLCDRTGNKHLEWLHLYRNPVQNQNFRKWSGSCRATIKLMEYPVLTFLGLQKLTLIFLDRLALSFNDNATVKKTRISNIKNWT